MNHCWGYRRSFLAGKIEEWWFAEEDSKLTEYKSENERIERLEKEYKLKIDRINDYLIRNHYIELRELDKDKNGNPLPNSNEAEELCKEASNIHSSYFKTILLMQSFHNYLDREIYKSLHSQDTQKDSKEIESSKVDSVVTESKKDLTIKSIADFISIKLAIQECYVSSKGELLRNTIIYIYNHRFQRVIAKGITDSKASLKIDNVSVGQEIGIDKLSFIVDRDNLSESNFELSKTQYATITNI